MIRGTTPTYTLTMPLDTSLVKTARVIFSQRDTTKVIKTDGQITMEGSELKMKLTQEETLAFHCDAPVDIQLRVLTNDGAALASGIYKDYVEPCLDNEVME